MANEHPIYTSSEDESESETQTVIKTNKYTEAEKGLYLAKVEIITRNSDVLSNHIIKKIKLDENQLEEPKEILEQSFNYAAESDSSEDDSSENDLEIENKSTKRVRKMIKKCTVRVRKIKMGPNDDQPSTSSE